MGLTITEKILARASGQDRVAPGDVVFAQVDKAMVHDVSGPGVKMVFDKLEGETGERVKVWNPDLIWVAEDHFVPCTDQQAAANIGILEKFVKRHGIRKYYRYGFGQYGICHTLSHEEGLVGPGEVYVGGDSHTNTTGALGCLAVGFGHTDMAYVLIHGSIWFRVPPTLLFNVTDRIPEHTMAKDLILRIIGDIGADGAAYKAMQFTGKAISDMSIEERLTLTNMTTEAGAKNGIVEPDQKTFDYLRARTDQRFLGVYGDPDAHFEEIYEYDGAKLEPLVAKPYSPSNVVSAREVSGTEIDKAYVGSCTGAKLTDLRAVASLLKGRKVKARTEILPAAQSIYLQASKEGLIQVFLESGVVVGPPTCGACCGAHMGVLRKEEVCVSTTNRNFPGRMGHKESKTYLASPLTVAASAVTGKITDPRDLRSMR